MVDPSRASDPLWLEFPTTPYPSLQGGVDVETLIVGGGVCGVTLAYTLAEQSVSVALLESGRLAAGATGRSAGFITLSPPEPYRELIALWGREGARSVLELGRRSHQRVRSLVERLGLDCGYRAEGSYRLARTEDEADDLRASLADLNADGFRVRETRVGSAVPESAARRFVAAFSTAEDGELDPARFVWGLANEAVRRGARVYELSPLRSARWSGGLWEARTEAGVVRARAIVVAANAWAPLLCPALGPLIAARRGQMLATAPIPRVVSTRPTLAHWGYHYWRQLEDGRLLIGGWRETDLDSEVGYEERTTEPIQLAIQRGLADLVPEGVEIERRWAGIMGFARDGRPLVGWLDPEHHVAIAAGYTGHGLSMAPACAMDLAQVLNWRPGPGIASLDPLRFPELARQPIALTELVASAAR